MPLDKLNGQTLLRQLLADLVDRTSYLSAADETGVAKTSIENYIKERNRELPKLESLGKFADYFGLPRWRIIAMTGWDLELPAGVNERTSRLVQLADNTPLLAEHLNNILNCSDDDLRSFLLALEIIKHQQHSHDAETPPEGDHIRAAS